MPFVPYYAPPAAQVAMQQQPAATAPTAAGAAAFPALSKPSAPVASNAVNDHPLAADNPPAGGSTWSVRSHGYLYTVTGNRLLPQSAVRAVLLKATSPKAAVAALKEAYVQRGYFLVAIVAHVAGVGVNVQIVQGRLTEITGPRSLARFFDGLKDDDTVRQSDVIRRSALAQAYAATNGQQPQISFHPAPQYGGSAMELNTTKLADSLPFGASLAFGNFGNRYAGHYLAQAQVTVHHAGVTVQLTQSNALPQLAKDTHGAFYRNHGIKLTWVTPLGVFGVDGSKTNYHLGKAFAPLFPAGTIETFGVTGTQLLYADATRRWSLSEGVHRIHDAETVFQGVFSLYDRRFNLVDLTSDFSWNFTGLGKLPAALVASGGVHWGSAGAGWGFVHQVGTPQSHFMIYTASVGLTQSLPRGFSLRLDVSGQATPDTLPSYEQWILGGYNNLAAWMPGTVAGDRGYLTRFTAQAPAWTLGPFRVAPSAFIEHAASRFSFITSGSPVWQRLTDAGAALSVGVPAAHLSGTLAWAKPMDSSNVSAVTRAGQRAHLFFYLNAGF